MRILVLLEWADDVRIPPWRDPRSGRVRPEWQVPRLEPGCARALDLALEFKAAASAAETDTASDAPSESAAGPASGPATDTAADSTTDAVPRAATHVGVVALTIGPEEGDSLLREALARGCDEVVRVWSAECLGLHAPGKAVVLAAAARALRCDLVLAGTSSPTTASARVGVLVAEHLDVPSVTQAVEFAATGEPAAAADAANGSQAGTPGTEPGTDPVIPAAAARPATGSVRAVRGLAGGYREVVEVSLPAVVTVLPGEPAVTSAPLPAVLRAHATAVPVWDLAELGVPLEQVRRADCSLRHLGVRVPRPAVRRVPAPDPTDSAFRRIGDLVRGTVQRREGRVANGSPEVLAGELFQALRDGGWLDHLRQEETE
ncbi:MAG: hypothetical protein KKA32_02250 [Actinobacteria bacterium]|nr:hypothetical protein [Actinomycetota bacterium]